MFSFYTLDIAYNLLFIFSVFYASRIHADESIIMNKQSTKGVALFLLVCLALLMGFYYIPYGSFGDRELYALGYIKSYTSVPLGSEDFFKGEWLFRLYMESLAFLRDPQYWFLCTAAIYLANYYVVAKRLFDSGQVLMLLALCASFGFISYGTNTIRAGLALSFVLVGFSFYRTLVKSLLFFCIAYNIHHSTAIPIAAFLIAKYYTRPKLFFYFWFFCVALSFVAGGYFTTLFNQFGQDFDARSSYLITSETHYNVGFRLDFVLYSCLPIVLGYIYQNRYGYQSRFYELIHSAYIIANGFWVLVIRANFSDRFAYLSWFMYALVVMYPLLDKPEIFQNVGKKIALTLLLISSFSYYMYLK